MTIDGIDMTHIMRTAIDWSFIELVTRVNDEKRAPMLSCAWTSDAGAAGRSVGGVAREPSLNLPVNYSAKGRMIRWTPPSKP